MDIAILLYDQMTALDAIGPYDVLARLPNATVKWVAATPGPIQTDAGLTLTAQYGLDEVTRPAIVVVPGGRQFHAMRDQRVLAWLRLVHRTTRYTTSVCTGTLVLGAAGLLRGARATTHWYALKQLRAHGATPVRERVVRHGKLITAAGVSAGIDMALYLAGELAGATTAKVIQLAIEYDPQPPYASGSVEKAPFVVRWIARLGMALYARRLS